MSETLLKRHRTVWNRKPVLRTIYADWYKKIRTHLKPGTTLEIGGGTGNLKEYLPQIITSDIVFLPWVNLVLDAHNLPFSDETLSNVVLFDVLHHLENPTLFFDDLVRVLQPEGRVILVEPYVSLASYPVYRFFHPEPMDMSQDPFELRESSSDREPFDANQAVPTLFFFRHNHRFQERYPNLRWIQCERLSFFAYPLSGGFDHPSILPPWAVEPLLAIERALSLLSPILAFRCFVVLQKE